MFSRLATPGQDGPAKLNTKEIQRRRKGEKIGSPATPDSAEKYRKTDEPGASLRQNVFTFDSARPGEAEHKSIQRRREAKDESTLAQTGHIELPRALARGAPLYPKESAVCFWPHAYPGRWPRLRFIKFEYRISNLETNSCFEFRIF